MPCGCRGPDRQCSNNDAREWGGVGGGLPHRLLIVRWADPHAAFESLEHPSEVVRALGGRVTWVSEFVPGLGMIEVPDGTEDMSAIVLREVGEFTYAHRDAWGGSLLVPNIPWWPDQAATLDPICVRSLWDHTVTATEPIAIVDTGIDFVQIEPDILHPDLGENVLRNTGESALPNQVDDDENGYVDDYWGAEFLPPMPQGSTDPRPRDRRGHGTAMASIIGAVGNNGMHMTGVAWKCKIIPIKSTDNAWVGTASSFMKGLEYAHKRVARIINCSWKVFRTDQGLTGLYDFFYHTPQTLYIVAAGNDTIDLDCHCYDIFPSTWSLANMIVVGATDMNDHPYGDPPLACCDTRPGSNYGASLVDVFAPGVDLYQLQIDGGPPTIGAGTSQAAAVVSAIAAFVWSKHPNYTVAQVKERIRSTADPISTLQGLCVTGARVNAARAAGATCP